MFWAEVRETYSYAGASAAATFVIARVLNALVNWCQMETMTLVVGDIDPKYFADPPDGLISGFLSDEQMVRFADTGAFVEDREYWMTSIANGDRCYGFIDGDRLVSYGWYSTKPTKVSGEFDFHFPDKYVYMHMGHTDPDYRGKRLHGIGMAKATEALTAEGHAGLISLVDSDNPKSMRSIQRLGYRLRGPIFLLARFNRFAAFHSPGAKRLGCWVKPRGEETVYLVNIPQQAAA